MEVGHVAMSDALGTPHVAMCVSTRYIPASNFLLHSGCTALGVHLPVAHRVAREQGGNWAGQVGKETGQARWGRKC